MIIIMMSIIREYNDLTMIYRPNNTIKLKYLAYRLNKMDKMDENDAKTTEHPKNSHFRATRG